jgi:pSer/pThr/pTyr-binding forkhead associated (FHA) protein
MTSHAERHDAVLVLELRSDRIVRGVGIDLVEVDGWEPFDDYSRRYPARRVVALPLISLAVTLGRSERAMLAPCVVIGDTAVSRRHCAVAPSASGWTVTDLGSNGGLHVNASDAANGGRPVPLGAGDYFFVGGYTDRRISFYESGGPLPAWVRPLVAPRQPTR